VTKPALIPIERPEKATRGGGVNGSQSKFLAGTWPISQNQLDASLFLLGQDRIAIEQLSTLRTGLGNLETQRKIAIDASRDPCETTAAKNESKGSSSPRSHFIKHFAGVFKEPPRESD
jgi:hypothetical protein